MARLLPLAFGFSLLCLGCQRGATPQQSTDAAEPQAAAPSDADELTIGESVRHANLTIFPIVSTRAKSNDRFLTLDEGLKSGQVLVMEMGSPLAAAHMPNVRQVAATTLVNPPSQNPFADAAPSQPAAQTSSVVQAGALQIGNDVLAGNAVNPFGSGPNVNCLLVVNKSDKPLYLMPGEIVVGGQQDRAVGHEYVIAPSETPVPIDVFCVEHGRWHTMNPTATANLLASASSNAATGATVAAFGASLNEDRKQLEMVAAKTAEGQFVASVGNVGKGTRLAVQGAKDQSGVWNQVGLANSASNTAANNASGTFSLNYADSDNLRRLEPYIEALTKPVAERTNVVGAIVAINGKVETLDVFESTPLFLRLWPKLLKSYALDAAVAPKAETEKVCSLDDARQFFTKARSGDIARTEDRQNTATTVRDLDDVICFTTHDVKTRPVAAAAAPAAPATLDVIGRTPTVGEAIHASGFSKK